MSVGVDEAPNSENCAPLSTYVPFWVVAGMCTKCVMFSTMLERSWRGVLADCQH